ncbi:beta strand repeat-containing protein [Pasteurella testudinis]|uniref:beta strand repeat-containing protein n=1 Tax=Pasteurella testudinis TaxID=761 RepID=UPI004059CAC3
MSTTLKVLNAKTEIASYNVVNGETLIIQAQDEVNYQLIDNSTGLGPQNIIAKRVGNDLQILLDNGDMVPDVIIEDYYGDEDPATVTNLVVGQHENGNMYAYVPESGQTYDAVSMLAEQMSAPQALGGDEISGLWVFSPWWLLALIPLAAVAIAAGNSGGSSDSKDTTPPVKPIIDTKDDGSVTVTPAGDAKNATVTYTDEDGNTQTVTIEKGNDGKWEPKGELPDGVTVDPDTGVITIPDEAIKGGSDVTATNSDEAGNESRDTKTSVDTDAPNAPVIDAKDDGSVTVTPADDATEATVTYTDEDGNTQTVTIEKGNDGKWEPKGELPDGVTVDPDTGVITIPDEAIKGGTDVTATNSDEAGNESSDTKTSVDTDAPNAPVIDAKDDGSVTVTPADDATEATVTYTDEDGNTQTITIEKNDDGKWEPKGELPDGVTVDPNTGVITIPDEAIKGGTDVTATNSDEAGNESSDTKTSVDTDISETPPTVTIPEADDGGINAEEIDDGVQVDVTIPKGTEPGDTVTVTVTDSDGNTSTVTHTVTQEDVDNGSAEVTVPKDVFDTDGDGKTDDGEYTVDAEISDDAGNSSGKSDPVTVDVDTTIPGDTDGDGTVDEKPVVTIPEAEDGINAEEIDDGVQVDVTIPKGTEPGDTVTVTVTDSDGNTSTVTHTVTQDDIDNGSAEVTVPKDVFDTDGDGKTDDGEYTVDAEISDDAGNSSGKSDPVTVDVDTTIPGDTDGDGTVDEKPVVTIPEAEDGINAEEIDDGVQVDVTIPKGTEPGDTVTVTVTDSDGNTSTVTHTVTQDDIDNGSAEVTVPKDVFDTDGDGKTDDGEYTVDAEITDDAGNSSGKSDPVTVDVDTTVVPPAEPGAPTITIPEAVDGVNAEELADGVQTEVKLPEGTEAGDVVTLTVTNPDGTSSTVTYTVTEEDATAGQAEVTIPKDSVAEDGEYKVTATITDAETGEVSPASPIVTFNVDATVPGDSDGDGVADDAGAPVVTIVDGGDEIINPSDLNEDGTVDVSITFPADSGYEAGDVLTVTNPDGSTQTVTLTADDIANGVTVQVTPVDGQVNEVKAVVADAAGNTSTEGKDTSTGDLALPGAPTITIPEAVDGVNAEELADGVQTEVKLPEGTEAGDVVTLTVTNPDGTSSTVTYTVTEEDATAGQAEVTIPKDSVVEDGEYKVTATITDAETGEVSPASPIVTFNVDTTVPGDSDGDGVADDAGAPVVTIVDGGDEIINPSDLNEDGTVDVSITFPADSGYEAGDVLTVTNPDGSTQTVTLTADDIANGVTVQVTPVDGQVNEVKAVVADAAGNTSTEGKDTSTGDLALPGAPTITIPEAVDGVNAEELADGVQTEVKLPEGTEAGDVVTLTVTNPDGTSSTVTYTVTEEDATAGQAEVTIPKDSVVEDGEYKVTATITDAETGEVSPASPIVTFNVDTTVPGDSDGDGVADDAGAPVVTIVDGGDEFINPKDLDENGQVDVTITFPADSGYEAGDVLTVTNPDGSTQTVTLTADDVANGVTVKVTPVDGQVNEVKAVVVDAAGNTSTEGKDTSTADLKVPGDSDGDGVADDAGAPVVTIVDGGDEFINPKDLDENGQVDVTITFPTDSGYEAGDVLTVTNPDGSTQTVTLTADDVANGVTVKVTPVDGQVNEVKAVVADAAGNTSTEGKDTSTADLQSPGGEDTDGDGKGDEAPVITFPEDIEGDGDGTLNAAEVGEDASTPVKISLPTGTEEGDIVVVTINGVEQEVPVTVADLNNGFVTVPVATDNIEQIDVTAYVKDASGNQSATGNGSVKVDTTVPQAPTVTPSTEDGSVTVTPADDAVKTDITYVDEDGVTQTVTVVKGEDGTWAAEDGTTLPEGVTVDPTTGVVTIGQDAVKDGSTVTATNTDTANNESVEGTGTAGVDKGPNAPTVTPSTEDGSVTVTPAEGAEKLDITYVDEDGVNQTVTVVKGEDGTWAPEAGTTLPTGVKVDPETGVVTIAERAVEDGSEVVATNSEGNNVSEEGKGIAGPNADTTVPGDTDNDGVADTGPVISFPEDVNPMVNEEGAPLFDENGDQILGNGILSAAEIGDDNSTPVEISLPVNTEVGDILYVTINGEEQEIEITEALLNQGSVTIDVPTADISEIEVTAYVEDAAGNRSLDGTGSVTIEEALPTASITLLDDLTDDYAGLDELIATNVYNTDGKTGEIGNNTGTAFSSLATGLTNDDTPNIKITLDKALAEGETLTVYRYKYDDSLDGVSPIKSETQVEIVKVVGSDTEYVVVSTDDQLDQTYGQEYLYKVVVSGIVDGEQVESVVQEHHIKLDTLVEAITVDNVSVNGDNRTFSGTTEAGATIRVTYLSSTNNNSYVTTETVADENGAYSLTLSGWNNKTVDGAEITVIDQAGNVKTASLHNFPRLYVNMNTEVGITAATMEQTILLQRESAQGLLMDDGNDYVILAGGGVNDLGNQGIFAEQTNGKTVVDMAGGDDYLRVNGALYDGVSVNMGAGDDKFEVVNNIAYGAYEIDMGEGNDIFTALGNAVGSPLNIDLGNGNNQLNIGGSMDTEFNFTGGAGDDYVSIGKGIVSRAASTMSLGDGDNTVAITGGISPISGSTTITTGAGDDIISVTGNISSTIYTAKVEFNLGEGNNTVYIEGWWAGNKGMTTGDGNDTLIVGGNIDTSSSPLNLIDLGNGDNAISIGGYISATDAKQSFITGDGNDTFTVGGYVSSGAGTDIGLTIDLGAGDDVLTIGATGEAIRDSQTVINGGAGNDILRFTGSSAKTEIDMTKVKGFEVIDLNDSNTHLNVVISDLIYDGAPSKIYITGGSSDFVDLGDNNWTSNTASSAPQLGTWTSRQGTGDDQGYTVWVDSTNPSVELYIQSTINVL